MNGAGVCESPMITVADPPITMSPCVPPVPMIAAFLPFMNTVEDRPEDSALPQVQLSPPRAAGKPSKLTSGEPSAMVWGPCPGIGQLVGSDTRAAGVAIFDSLSLHSQRSTLSEIVLKGGPPTHRATVRADSRPSKSTSRKLTASRRHLVPAEVIWNAVFFK